MSDRTVVDLTSSSPILVRDNNEESSPPVINPWPNSQPSFQPGQNNHQAKRRRLNSGTVAESSSSAAAAASTSAIPVLPASVTSTTPATPATPSTPGRTSEHHLESDGEEPPEIEEVDLTGSNGTSSLSKILAKQREDAIKAQLTVAEEKPSRSILTAYRCPVCMDIAENATSTICGHLFCHKCIIDTMRYNEERRTQEGATKSSRGTCPVCRKVISKTDTPGPKRNLVPLRMKFTTRKRKA